MNLIVYDNTIPTNELIKEVIGQRGYGDVVVRRRTLKETYMEKIHFFPDAEIVSINSFYDIDHLIDELTSIREPIHVLHCCADHIILNETEAAFAYKKLPYIEENLQIVSDTKNIVALMFPNAANYRDFLSEYLKLRSLKQTVENRKFPIMTIHGIGYIGEIGAFIQCVTGGFDARYFNSIKGSDYVLRKSSKNKEKILREYTFYHLLPDYMKHWFVMPFDYRDDGEFASYAMERLHMTDVAIKWIHNSFDQEEFSQLMDLYFAFFSCRASRKITPDKYASCSKNLYEDKVRDRIEELKKTQEYPKIKKILECYGSVQSLEELFDWYLSLKEKIECTAKYEEIEVIGHGDPCFANTMYNRATKTLKLIDPKGALKEEELWTNPYYDLAKLSHSVCGRYDFFNNAMFEIQINDKLLCMLKIPFNAEPYKKIFRQKLEEHGFDYWTVRIYEVSLFLSMLPLHIDYPQKVCGFILNAIEILEEIEKNV